jgi:CelD/BcsL family acetyltransferase involved in cellulose biosynthesis
VRRERLSLPSTKEERRHEKSPIPIVFVCTDELRRGDSSVLLRHRKEERVVERQLCASTPKVSASPLTVACVDDLDQFNILQPEWDALVERSAADPVFLSHVWLRTWWECFGQGRKLHVILVWAGNQLIGAAPMMQSTGWAYGVPLRRLESIYNYHTPRFDLPIAERHDEVYAAIWKELSRDDGAWDAVILAQVPEESPTLERLNRCALNSDWRPAQWLAQPSPVISLGCDYETVMGRLKGKERYSLRKRLGRLSEMGAVELETIRERGRVREVMEDVLRIEAAAWKGENGTAMKSDPAVAEFYARLAERAADLGWLRIYFLRLGEKRIALDYALQKERTVYAVKIGYDPEFHTYSPGHLLLQKILQRACGERYQAYDFLGADDEWKYVWTQQVRHHRWLFLFRNRLWPRLICTAKFGLLPRLKRLARFGRVQPEAKWI